MMGVEINLLSRYPKSHRDLSTRVEQKTDGVRKIARKFGKDFFDGDRRYGYGGFTYNPKFWTDVVIDFISYYQLTPNSKILDVGCAKGFMLYDFYQKLPNAYLRGIDVSQYAIINCKPEVAKFLSVANAINLPFDTNEFDLAISINTLHNLPLRECKIALKELSRVTNSHSFITVDAYRTDEEKERMFDWNLTAKTILSVEDWIQLFEQVGYTGDYYWFTP
jgi:ubiquinone/menaquinone biosynthesis C-methylase UbiE